MKNVLNLVNDFDYFFFYIYEDICVLANRDVLQWDPSVECITISQMLNSYSVGALRLISFFKQIPEFIQLNNDDKFILIKYNLIPVAGINCSLSFNTETNQIVETNSDIPWNTQIFPMIFGYQIITQLQKVFDSFLQIGKFDQKIIQLLLIILILTKGYSIPNNCEPILNDIISVYKIQNNYIELLWKYLEVNHGFQIAVSLYSQLIGSALSWQRLQEDMRMNILRILSPKDIEDLLPILKSIWYQS